MLKIAALLLLLLLTACAAIQDQARTVVERVCAMDPIQRSAARATIDAATWPHTIRIDCNSDGDDL